MLWSERRRIDPANHSFSGFPAHDGVAHMLDGELRVGTAPLDLTLHRDLRYSPPDIAAPDPWATGGLITAGRELLPFIRNWTDNWQITLGLAAPVDEHPRETFDDDVLYLGWLFDAFGHLLIESLARAWALDLVPRSLKVLFHYWPGVEPPAHVLDWLSAFGIPRDRIIIPQGPALFRSLLIPDPAILITSMVHERAGKAFQAAADRIAGNAPPSSQPVYLSRSLLPSSKRAVAGEDALEAVLRDNGFLIVHPETMSAVQQIRLAARHQTFVTCKGGAAELLLFARPGARCHLFAARHLLEVNVLISELAGLRAAYHNVLGWRGHQFAARRLDLEAAIAALADDGLLPDRSRLPYLPAPADLDAEFEELWLFGMLTQRFPMEGESLAMAERIIDTLRPTAWPVFAALAALMPEEHLGSDQADALMALFADALMAEPDGRRRFRHAGQVRDLAALALPRCSPETRQRASRAVQLMLP